MYWTRVNETITGSVQEAEGVFGDDLVPETKKTLRCGFPLSKVDK